MQHHHRPVFEHPFELWREDGVLRLVLARGAQVDLQHMKEFIRLVAALDPSGSTPVLMEYPAHVLVADNARALLRRVCGAQGHPVALVVADEGGRAQAELFKYVERPSFPFRIFDHREEAEHWARGRRSTATVHAPGGRDR
jgi:hypothetical protein